MQATPPQTDESLLSKQNIYEKYILPYINSAQKGDELLFISPSTFFGFYTLGAHNFHQICEALRQAKERGAEIRLIIDVHDQFTAKAAEGLFTFLADEREIRNLEANVHMYQITVYSKQGGSKHVEFVSESPLALQYLPGIQIRPFGGIKQQPLEKMSDLDAENIRGEFYRIWNKDTTAVENIVTKYLPAYQARRSLVRLQGLTYLLTFIVGLFTGIMFSLQNQPQLSVARILFWLVATLGVGLLGNWLASLFTWKRFG